VAAGSFRTPAPQRPEGAASRPGRAEPAEAGDLDGELTLRVWGPGGRRGLDVAEAEALPVRNAEMVHLGARLNRPAFIYLFWIDSRGRVQPLYPWDPARGFASRPPREVPRRTLESPAELDRGWEVEGASGLETAVLLARRTPLPTEMDLAPLVGPLPVSPLGDLRERQVWKLTPGLPAPSLIVAAHRGLKLKAEARRIDDPLVRLLERLRPHFELIQAVRFAHEGE
jgi:hypothetical protein